MDFSFQGRRAVAQHSEGLTHGKTCIDCHKGIAHSLPAMYDVDPTSVVGNQGKTSADQPSESPPPEAATPAK